jgi:pterin-4a-carbinolamine dehydratase
MAPLVFISYRRTDSQQAALGLASQLRARLGPGSIFMDRSGISAGDVWPQRLQDVIRQATVVLAVVGPDWLKAADEYGRRRLDMPEDWVRNELLGAINSGKPLVPVLLPPLLRLPVAEALPVELRPLLDYQALSLREDHWDSDLNELVRLLVDRHGCREVERQVILPQPEVSLSPLTDAELHDELKLLSRWEPVESLIPGDYPKSRKELRRVYTFRSFRSAVGFMGAAVEAISKAQHHPRWENQWRTVTVYLTTWDIGFRVSRLDIEMAKALDGIYEEAKRPPTQAAASS